MIKRIGFAAVLWTFLGAGWANAALQPPVSVESTQWLQPLDFLDYSWDVLSTVCDPMTGACSGSLAGNDLTGWTWASVDDVNTLFNHYIGTAAMGPGPSTVTYESTNWMASIMADGFLPTNGFHSGYDADYIQGRLRTSYSVDRAYTGSIGSSTYPIGFFFSSYADTDNTLGKSYGNNGIDGAWLYRGDINSLAVPVTNTLALLGLGLVALGYAGRKHRSARFFTPA